MTVLSKERRYLCRRYMCSMRVGTTSLFFTVQSLALDLTKIVIHMFLEWINECSANEINTKPSSLKLIKNCSYKFRWWTFVVFDCQHLSLFLLMKAPWFSFRELPLPHCMWSWRQGQHMDPSTMRRGSPDRGGSLSYSKRLLCFIFLFEYWLFNFFLWPFKACPPYY